VREGLIWLKTKRGVTGATDMSLDSQTDSP